MESVFDILVKYKNLSAKHKSHKELLNDKTIILYVATLLENKNLEIVDLCLDILENFIDNEQCHGMLMATFGLFESLESLAINARNSDGKIARRAANLTESLRKSAPPAYGTRLRKNAGRNNRSHTFMYHLYVPGLTILNRQLLDETLVQIKGIISFVVDVEQQRCTIRINQRTNIEAIVSRILEETDMNSLVITRNPVTKTERLVDVLEEKKNKTLPLEYFDEDSPPKKHAIQYYTQNLAKNAGGILKSATDFWNKSFYW